MPLRGTCRASTRCVLLAMSRSGYHPAPAHESDSARVRHYVGLRLVLRWPPDDNGMSAKVPYPSRQRFHRWFVGPCCRCPRSAERQQRDTQVMRRIARSRLHWHPTSRVAFIAPVLNELHHRRFPGSTLLGCNSTRPVRLWPSAPIVPTLAGVLMVPTFTSVPRSGDQI